MRLILHRTVGADNAPPGPARWGCRRLLPIDCRDGPQSVHANLLSCLSSTFAVIASESTKQAARFPADQPQKHSLFVL